MDERRKTYIDSRIRRGYINRTERKLFKRVFVISAIIIAICLLVNDIITGTEKTLVNMIFNNCLNGIVLGIVLGMIVSATHNLFRQQVLRNFTGTKDYIEFREKELQVLYDKGLITESEYFDSLEN